MSLRRLRLDFENATLLPPGTAALRQRGKHRAKIPMKATFLFGFAMCGALLISGCSKKQPTTSVAEPPAKPRSVSMEEVSGQPANAPVAAQENSEAPPVAPQSQSVPVNPSDPITVFNQALRKWAEDYNIVPANLEALKQQAQTFPGLPPLPTPPPGRRLVYSYDKQTMEPRTVAIKVE